MMCATSALIRRPAGLPPVAIVHAGPAHRSDVVADALGLGLYDSAYGPFDVTIKVAQSRPTSLHDQRTSSPPARSDVGKARRSILSDRSRKANRPGIDDNRTSWNPAANTGCPALEVALGQGSDHFGRRFLGHSA